MPTHPFDAYLATQPQPQRDTLLVVAARLRALLPTAQETISYAMPAFKVDGIVIAGIAGFKRHCSYFPHSGNTLDRIPHLLEKYESDDGTLRFAIDAPLPTTLLRALIKARVEAEEAHGPRGGIVRHFYSNGTLKAKGPVRNNKMHGTWSWYRKDGSLLRTGHFTAGQQTAVRQ